jgi:putative ABC transport system permease protein
VARAGPARLVARGATGLAVALGLAASTAVFTATYDQQATLDVALTVGADVAVTEPPGAAVPPSAAADLFRAPGARAVEPLVHRFAYVGPDLQDVYGIDPARIGRVAPLQDSFTAGSTVQQAMNTLGRTPDGVLLSAETLHDYQLHPGDLVRLRLPGPAAAPDRSGPGLPPRRLPCGRSDHRVPDRAEGLVRHRELLLPGRTDRLGRRRDLPDLLRGPGPDGGGSAGPGRRERGDRFRHPERAEHRDDRDGAGRRRSGALSRLELGFGVLLALACSALALLLGVAQRRRALVLLAALGATARQRGRFLSAEAWGLLVGGLLGGVAVAATISFMLVKVLTGIFDPPPSSAALPLGYLAALASAVVVALVAVVAAVGRLASRAGPAELRDL